MRRGFLAKRTTAVVPTKRKSKKSPQTQPEKNVNKEVVNKIPGKILFSRTIHYHCQVSKIEDLENALKSHPHCIEEMNYKKETPLFTAISANYKDAVALLVSRGANVNVKRMDGDTPLIVACRNGCNKIAEVLLKNGAEIDAKDNLDQTSLHLAVANRNLELIQLLVSSGANVNVKRKDGDTPLILACKNNCNKIAEVLLKNGAEVDVKDRLNRTPLHLAVNSKNLELVHLLISFKANLNLTHSLLKTAIEDDSLKMTKVLLEHGASLTQISPVTNETPFITACKKGNLDIVKEIFKYNPGLDCFDIDDLGPLHWAVLNGDMELIQLLLNSGMDVNSKGPKSGDTVLHLISRYLSMRSENELDTSSEEELSDSDEDDEDDILNPLDLIFHALRDQFFGAYEDEEDYYDEDEDYFDPDDWDESSDEPSLTDEDSDSDDDKPIHLSTVRDMIEKLIIEKEHQGADNPASPKHLKKMIELLLSAGADVNAQNDSNNTPLHVACLFKQTEIAKMYVNNKAALNILNKRQLTPLHYAIQKNLPEDLIKMLLQNGAFVDVADAKGNTPMHYCKKINIFKLLLLHGADINCENEYNNVSFKWFKFKNTVDMDFIFRHVIKLKILGYKISDTIQDIMDTHCHRDFRLFKETLLKELKLMKKVVLNKNQGVSLYHLLFMKLQNILPYMKNAALNGHYAKTNRDFETKYAHYGYLLNSKYEKAKKRLEVLEPAREVFQSLVGDCLAEPCCEGVLSFLNNSVLKDLISINL